MVLWTHEARLVLRKDCGPCIVCHNDGDGDRVRAKDFLGGGSSGGFRTLQSQYIAQCHWITLADIVEPLLRQMQRPNNPLSILTPADRHKAILNRTILHMTIPLRMPTHTRSQLRRKLSTIPNEP